MSQTAEDFLCVSVHGGNGVIRLASPLIRFSDVEHVYNPNSDREWRALHKIHLDIWPGEFVAVLGHNGSGKSTLAKHTNALLLPTEGKVFVAGMDTSRQEDLWSVRQCVGMVFQNPDNQLVATTVEEDVAFGPENLGIPSQEIRQRVDEALAKVGMLEYRTHPPHELSGGQKQRVAIAGMIAMRPRCIVLDEPTAMLDPLGRREVMETISGLNKDEGITIVHITHFMQEAITADRVVVMEEGEIVLAGTPRQVFSNVEAMLKYQLDVPQVAALAHRLHKSGRDISEQILSVDEMVRSLCP